MISEAFHVIGGKEHVLEALQVFRSEQDMESFLRHVSQPLGDAFYDAFIKRLESHDEAEALTFAAEAIADEFADHYRLGRETYDLERLAADYITSEPYRERVRYLERIRAASLHRAGSA